LVYLAALGKKNGFFREISTIRAVKKGSKDTMERETEAFIELLTGAQGRVYGYLLSLCHDSALAKNLLQETNLTLWRKAENYEEGTNFGAWACKAAYYHLLNHRRKARRESLVFEEEVFDYLAERQEQRLDGADERLKLLQGCLAKLPDQQRKWIEQRYQSSASVQSMAKNEGMSEGAFSQALYRIRHSLQKCVQSQLKKGGAF